MVKFEVSAGQQGKSSLVKRSALQAVSDGDGATPSNQMVQRILDAAYECFDTKGLVATTLGDIAKAAQVSRPTVYRYFAGKAELVETISELESVKVKSEVKRKLQRVDEFEEALTEAMVLIIRVASKNIYVRRLVVDPDFAPRSLDPRGHYHEMQKLWWGSFLTNAIARGDVASDLSIDDVVNWLTASMRTLLLRVLQTEETDRALRSYIRRFIVHPLVSKP